MAQGIRPMNNQLSYAEEALPLAMAARGNQAMNLPNPGRRNATDGGDFSKVNMNPQIQINNGHVARICSRICLLLGSRVVLQHKVLCVKNSQARAMHRTVHSRT